MKKLFRILIVFGVIIGIMLITCPDEEKHINKVTKEIVQSARNAAEGDKTGIISGILDNPIVGSIGESAVKFYLNDKHKVSDYGLLNVGKMTINGEEAVVSIGLFNHVFATSKVDELINNISF